MPRKTLRPTVSALALICAVAPFACGAEEKGDFPLQPPIHALSVAEEGSAALALVFVIAALIRTPAQVRKLSQFVIVPRPDGLPPGGGRVYMITRLMLTYSISGLAPASS